MNRFLTLFLAAILGSAVTIIATRFITGNGSGGGIVSYSKKSNSSDTTYKGHGAGINFRPATAKALPSVVHIHSAIPASKQYNDMGPFRDFFGDDFWGRPREEKQRLEMATGSGVIVSPDGYIVTNDHVIAGAKEINVTLNDNRSFKAKLIGTDPSTDIALIKVDESDLPFISFSNSDFVEVGDWVLAVGNPFNLSSTVTAGIISAKARNISILQDKSAIESFLQTDAAVNPGNSGGALINLEGDLIGITTAIATPTGAYAGYAFAVPSNIVAKVIEDLKQYGVVHRAYLGVVIRDMDSDLAKTLGLKSLKGTYVESVVENSAAFKAGLKAGDVILAIDGVEIGSTAKLLELIGIHHPGDNVKLTVLRDGKEKEFKVELKNSQGKVEVIKKEVNEVEEKLGADFEELTDQEKKKYGITGVKVKSLGSGILSEQTNMKEGFIVTGINHKPIKDLNEFNEVLSAQQGGVLLEGVYPGSPGKYYYAFGLE
ncbi:Do family serine endopeptidase [Sporocytophaga myxococcoides]|uniref:Do family serine endopeptidase n=1 Tax=Sporocytophaga myxococcoides TaxID=153721 RepID=UPI00040258FC|nr:Do family serine endopeptidase [Sporocytophaga myxococcoides]